MMRARSRYLVSFTFLTLLPRTALPTLRKGLVIPKHNWFGAADHLADHTILSGLFSDLRPPYSLNIMGASSTAAESSEADADREALNPLHDTGGHEDVPIQSTSFRSKKLPLATDSLTVGDGDSTKQPIVRRHSTRHPPQIAEAENLLSDEQAPLQPTYPIPSYFSLDMSTEENYGIQHMEFYGPFETIRSNLDYSYHGNYIRSRQLFQDNIVEKLLNGTIIRDPSGRVCKTPTEPWIVFTAGVMGAGKSHTIKRLASQGLFPLQSYVAVDPDEIRQHFPEYHLYATLYPERAGELTHKEAGYVTEIVTAAALKRGHNVLVDGSLWDADWYQGYFEKLRKDYKNMRIAILHITAPREAVFKRAKNRAIVTGRVVPHETLEMSLKQVPISITKLSPLADFFCELDNAPEADEITISTDGITWDSFRDVWSQTCPWPPNQRGKM